jgi:hypothetical protein
MKVNLTTFPGKQNHLARVIFCIVVLYVGVFLLCTKGITSEGTVSLQGDMPRYLMNGTYFYDLIRYFPLGHMMEYTYQYYARYPALSLGHHPLLPGAATVPFYSLLGISIFSARWSTIFFMLLGVTFWFFLIRFLYEDQVAFFSSLLWLTTPFVVSFSRIVMSEIPTLALIIVTVYFFFRYCEQDKPRYAFAFAVGFALSIYAKHLAGLMLPIFIVYLSWLKGVRKLISKEMILSGILIILLIVPLIPLTLKFSQASVALVTDQTLFSRLESFNVLYHLKALWQHHLTLPVLFLSLISMGAAIYRKDPRETFFLLWIAGYYLQITFMGVHEPRFSIYWIPAFCLFAATTILLPRDRFWKTLLSILLLVIVTYQFIVAFKSEPEYAEGYEEAAKYVIENRKGKSVLFSANVDTGYFVFFVRKQDPHQDLIVLRADKVLATSKMDQIVEERVTSREQIYEVLQDFGIGYVVLEDMEYESPSLEWLREEVKTDRFILHKRIPIRTNSYKLQDVALAIYEYKDYTPPKKGKMISLDIPLMGDSISVRLDDLICHRPL